VQVLRACLHEPAALQPSVGDGSAPAFREQVGGDVAEDNLPTGSHPIQRGQTDQPVAGAHVHWHIPVGHRGTIEHPIAVARQQRRRVLPYPIIIRVPALQQPPRPPIPACGYRPTVTARVVLPASTLTRRGPGDAFSSA
jgi:hypothetical protein